MHSAPARRSRTMHPRSAHTLDALGLTDADLAGDGIGAAVALAMAHENPKRYPHRHRRQRPPARRAAAARLSSPEAFGEHLIRAWHTVRDDAIHGAVVRAPAGPAAPLRIIGLDMDGIHRRAVDALKGANPLDLCKAALAAPIYDRPATPWCCPA